MITYKHNKTGDFYLWLGEALNCTNSNDGEEMVIYRKLYGLQTFFRNKKEFHEKFTEVKNDDKIRYTVSMPYAANA